MTNVVPERRCEFDIEGMGRGAFEAQPVNDKVKFLAEVDIGSDAPILGSLFDFFFSRLFAKRIEAMRQHMVEEGANLKAILEANPTIDS